MEYYFQMNTASHWKKKYLGLIKPRKDGQRPREAFCDQKIVPKLEKYFENTYLLLILFTDHNS